MNVKPFVPPRMTPGMVAARKRLYRSPARFACAFGWRRWVLDLPERAPAPVWRVRLGLTVGDWPLTVLLDGLLAADWPESGLDAAALARLPPPLAGALLEVRMEEVVERLEPRLGKPVLCDRLDLIDEPSAPGADGVPFRLTRDDGQTLCGLLKAPPPVLELLAGALETAGGGRGLIPSELPVKLPLEVGTARLRTADLRDLGAGDVILVRAQGQDRRDETTEEDGTRGLRVRLALSARRGLNANLHGGTVRVESWSMTNDEWTNETGDRPGGVDDVPVVLRFSLGEVTCTLGELTGLKPGYVFATTARTEAPVRITVNGTFLGEGSLVDVNGLLGVRLINLTWSGSEATPGAPDAPESAPPNPYPDSEEPA